MKQLLLALQFLTILPVGVKEPVTEKEVAQSAGFFPLVGLIQGSAVAFSAVLLLRLLSPEIVSGLVIWILIMSNGGFHLDGLADTFDAIAVRSSGNESDREKRLAVAKDSATGAIGVIAIVFSVLFKYLFVKDLLVQEGNGLKLPEFFPYLLLMPSVSKWTMTVAMFHGTPARKDGLGRIFINGIRFREIFISTLILLCIYTGTLIIFDGASISLYVFVTLVLYSSSSLWLYFCNKKFGGSTGDTLGALHEISEILFLFMVIIWQRYSI